MEYLPEDGIAPVTEAEATGEFAAEYANIKRVLELPFVPNLFKVTAKAPPVLAGTWALERDVFLGTSLPMRLATMILYAISSARQTGYCSAVHQLTGLSAGVDEATLSALAEDPDALEPGRDAAIVKFACKAALEPKSLGAADYEELKDRGVSETELVEIVGLAALGNYMDTLADALKVPLDDIIIQALAG